LKVPEILYGMKNLDEYKVIAKYIQ